MSQSGIPGDPGNDPPHEEPEDEPGEATEGGEETDAGPDE